MKISELAKRCGVSARALRHYEHVGLLRPERHPNGYRDYSEAMRREVVFISMSRKIGFSLATISEQLPVYRAGRLSIAIMVESLQNRVADIDRQLAALDAQRAEVMTHMAWLQALPAKNSSGNNFPKPTRKRSNL